jgi:hypothetical protein
MIRTEAVTEISLRFYLIFDSYHGKKGVSIANAACAASAINATAE